MSARTSAHGPVDGIRHAAFKRCFLKKARELLGDLLQQHHGCPLSQQIIQLRNESFEFG